MLLPRGTGCKSSEGETPEIDLRGRVEPLVCVQSCRRESAS